MASIFESTKVFEQRVQAIGLGNLWPRFEALGWTKFSVLAFSSDYVPGASDTSLFTTEVVKPIAGEVAEDIIKYKPLLKRLFTEAYTMARIATSRARCRPRSASTGFEVFRRGSSASASRTTCGLPIT